MVNRYRPDYVGFILASGRTRTITKEQAVYLRYRMDTRIPAVGVFVNEDPAVMAEYVHSGIVQILQLHGGETKETVKTLKSLCKAPIIKAISVKDGSEIDEWNQSDADYLLLDHGAGGSGESFDWKILSAHRPSKPFFLAGGINAGNADEAMRYLPYALDCSGGVETDGYKDDRKIKEFINIVRGE